MPNRRRCDKKTPERVEAILRDLRLGCTFKAAAECNGIDRDTLYLWIAKDSALSALVREAESQAERHHTVALAAAAKSGDWKASVEWLKRRRPDDWGDRVTHDIDADIARLLAEVAGCAEGGSA